uniref:Potassium channel domain-containing protein n=1 Tax=Eptatretus burgeri TaxID=7764 RepID=A0A8C4R4W5_EPTBU
HFGLSLMLVLYASWVAARSVLVAARSVLAAARSVLVAARSVLVTARSVLAAARSVLAAARSVLAATHLNFSSAGFGMSTPATTAGKVFLIFYGLFGCSANILSTSLREEAPLVFFIALKLIFVALLLSCCASTMKSYAEGWTFLDSFYFSFVAFSIIGFGDLVPCRRAGYQSQVLYQVANLLCILLGVCCVDLPLQLVWTFFRRHTGLAPENTHHRSATPGDDGVPFVKFSLCWFSLGDAHHTVYTFIPFKFEVCSITT